MMGPDIFNIPFIGIFIAFLTLIIYSLLLVRFLSHIFVVHQTPLRLLEVMKTIIIFIPLLLAFNYLLGYAEFDLVQWLNFIIIMLGAVYLFEIIYRNQRRMVQ